MYPRPPFPTQWPGQAAGPRRFPQRSLSEVGSRHLLNAPINNPISMQGMQGMPNPLAVAQGAGADTMQPPPQFIELKHNARPVAPQFLPRAPQPRPRMFIPQQEVPSSFVQHPLDTQTESGQDPRLGLPQSSLQPQSQLQPQPIPTTPSNTPSSSHSTTQQQGSQTNTVGVQRPTGHNVSLTEPDLEDPFATKDLGDAGAEAGVEDEDDLALDLDPDKGDDDLGNLDNLETNDPHLDDLLNSDEFDLLAYTDPELDQGDPKDVFSDQLRLVEAEGESSGPPVTTEVKVEEKPKVSLVAKGSLAASTQPPSKTESKTVLRPLKAESSNPCGLSSVKLEEKDLVEQQQSAQTVVKDEMREAVSLLLSGTASKTSALPENSPASLNTVRLGGVPFPLPTQTDPLSFPPPTSHSDLGEDPLGLPDGGGQHSPAVDLDKVESSLEASELPLLIQDLLEHEKKELQKQQQQQQLNALQGGLGSHLHNLQNQQQPPTGTNQIILPHHRPPQGLVGQPAMVPRPPNMLSPQQQRLLGAAMPPPPHVAMGQSQGMMRGGQPSSIHPALNPQQQAAPPQHLAKQPPIPSNFFPDKGMFKCILHCV